MLTTELIAEVKDTVKAPNATLFPPDIIVRAATRQYRSLFRTMVFGNKEYANFPLALFKANAVQLFSTVYQYRTPTWISHVVDLYQRTDAGTTNTSMSPYLWTGTPASLGQRLFKDREGPRLRWSWEGQHTLRVYGSSVTLDLVAMCVKIPTKPFVGTIDTANAAQNKLYLPVLPQHGSAETEEGAYINSEWTVTGTSSANATQFGDVRRCIYSQANAVFGGARVQELTFDANFTSTLVSGDQVETVLAIPDEHTRLLVLKTATALYQKEGNIKAIASLQGEMQEELAKFLAYASGMRDSKGPRRMKRRTRDMRWQMDMDSMGCGYGYGSW